MKTNDFISSNIEEYSVVDTFERRLKKLGFGGDLVWDLIAHIRESKKMIFPIYPSDQDPVQLMIDMGILLEHGQVFCYDTTNGVTHVYSPFLPLWNKLSLWKNKNHYCLEIIES